MVLSKFLPKSKDPNFSRNLAVLVALILIFAAFFIALLIAFLLPKIIPLVLPDGSLKGLETTITLLIQLMSTALFLVISWDMVNALVGSAIEAAVNEEVRKNSESFERELSEYKRINSLESVLKRQNKEFYSTICSITPDAIKDVSESPVALYNDTSLHRAFRRRVARDLINQSFAYNDDILMDIALSACKRALNKAYATELEACQDVDLQLFRQDIYVYLKAWLIFSIANEREMPIEDIKHRYVDVESPKESWKRYLAALTDVKERLIKHPEVTKCLDTERENGSDPLTDYKEDAIQLLDEYLGKLIFTMRRHYNLSESS